MGHPAVDGLVAFGGQAIQEQLLEPVGGQREPEIRDGPLERIAEFAFAPD